MTVVHNAIMGIGRKFYPDDEFYDVVYNFYKGVVEDEDIENVFLKVNGSDLSMYCEDMMELSDIYMENPPVVVYFPFEENVALDELDDYVTIGRKFYFKLMETIFDKMDVSHMAGDPEDWPQPELVCDLIVW